MKTEEYKFENGLSIRVPFMENETSWFVAPDVCAILGLSDTSQSVERLDEDEKRKEKIQIGVQAREVWLVNEFGLYQLILSSDKAEAKAFKRWITHDILPLIRKNGKYTIEEANNRESLIQGKVKQIELIETDIKSINNTLAESKKKLFKSQLELKEILKADINQLTLFPTTEQV